MTFAALQTRVNAAVAARVMTDAATLNSVPLKGKFDNGSASVLNMLGGSNPVFKCLEEDLLGVDPRSLPLIYSAVTYIVRENKPDGNGMTSLELDKQ
jgi:hypothetical protein